MSIEFGRLRRDRFRLPDPAQQVDDEPSRRCTSFLARATTAGGKHGKLAEEGNRDGRISVVDGFSRKVVRRLVARSPRQSVGHTRLSIAPVTCRSSADRPKSLDSGWLPEGTYLAFEGRRLGDRMSVGTGAGPEIATLVLVAAAAICPGGGRILLVERAQDCRRPRVPRQPAEPRQPVVPDTGCRDADKRGALHT